MSAVSASVRPSIVAGEQHLIVTVPLQMKRRGGRKQIIVPEGIGPEPAEVRTNEPLALTVARARRWRELLDQGRFGSLSELARALGLSHAYLSRLMRLAPDIIEAMLDGTEPGGPSIAGSAALPAEWEGQREALGVQHSQ